VNSELQSKVIPGLFFCHSGLDPESLSQKDFKGWETLNQVQSDNKVNSELQSKVIPDLLFCHSGLAPESKS
jgi:hypothetical protein